MHLDNEIAAKQSQCNIGLENNILLFRAAIQALEDFDIATALKNWLPVKYFFTGG